MRKNKGIHEGKFVGRVFEHWSIYRTVKGYRLAADIPVGGKANYHFAILDGQFDRHLNFDAAKLQEERPELYQAVEEFFRNEPASAQQAIEDEFGDFTAGKPLTQMQQWKRALLDMRETELVAAAKPNNLPRDWDMGIRMHYSGIFKFKIDEGTYKAALEYIANHGPVDLQALLVVLRDRYDGKYGTSPRARLNMEFNRIAGKGENNDLL